MSSDGRWVDGLIVGMIISMVICMVLIVLFYFNKISLKQEVADEICVKLTGEDEVKAYQTDDSKLKCVIPSPEESHNIIIVNSGDDDDG